MITYDYRYINTYGFKVILQDLIEGVINIHDAGLYHGEVELYNLVVSGGRRYIVGEAKLVKDKSELEMQ